MTGIDESLTYVTEDNQEIVESVKRNIDILFHYEILFFSWA